MEQSEHGLRHRRLPRPQRQRRLGGDGGQGLVEFALILPVFLLLLLGMVDFGSAYNIHNDMTQLAGEAVRFASVDTCGDGCIIVNQVRQDADNGCLSTGSGCSPTVGWGPGEQLVVCFAYELPPGVNTPTPGVPVTAVVESTYKWLPFLGLADVKLRASATMRLEVPPSGGAYSATTLTPDGDCPP